MENTNTNSKTKKILFIILGILMIVIVFLIIKRNYNSKFLIKTNNTQNIIQSGNAVDVVSGDDYKKFEGGVSANFEGIQNLDFYFIYKNNNKVEQGKGDQDKWFKIFDKNGDNFVTVYFTYEGGRGWSIEDYIQNVLEKNNSDLKTQDVKFTNEDIPSLKYSFSSINNSEYFVKSIKNTKAEPWLLIVENTKADSTSTQEISRDIVRSFEIK